MVICMEMMLVLVEDEEAADIGEGGDKAWGIEEVWPRWKEDTCVVALPSIMCHHKRVSGLNVLMSMSASRGHCGSTGRTGL